MFYSFDLSVPPNTPSSAPVLLLARLTLGTIHRVEVMFPPGPLGLLHVRIFRGLTQLWPSNAPGDLAADDVTIAWAEDYEITDEPTTLRIYAWNDDDFFSHTATIRFALIPQAQAHRQNVALQALDFLARWFTQRGAT